MDFCIYIAINEKTLKIGKSSYKRRFIRAWELNSSENLITVKRYSFSGNEEKALFFESALRSKISRFYGMEHYGLDHFNSTANNIQTVVDCFDSICKNIEELYKMI